MKKYIMYIVIGLIIASCSDDFTNLDPISSRNEAVFFTTANDFVASINASYARLQNEGLYGRSYWGMFEMRSDNTDQGPDQTGLARQFTELNAFTEDALNEQIDVAFSDSYRLIANCNLILDRISGVEFDAALKERITGEALFLRSLIYYHLIIAFENVPLQLTPFLDGELPQSNATAIYTQLVIDLTTAESSLPISYTTSDVGRATKGAAATLLAKVLLTMNNNTEAVPVLRRIISEYGYNLVTNYANLWGTANENNIESIFEVQYTSGGIGQGSAFTNDFSPSPDLQTGQGFNRNRPNQTLVDAYVMGDTRRNASIGTEYVDASMNTIQARYIRKYESQPSTENDSGINFVVFRYADVLLMLAEALGESGESYNLINEVRLRAIPGAAPIDNMTSGTFEEKLLAERQLELAFENHRWADLKRFGVAAQKVNEAEPSIAVGAVRELYLIPQREIDINTNWVQN